MCLLTVATAAMYSEARRSGKEYNFVVRTDSEGVSKIRSHLADADFHRVEEAEIEDGLYRITVRCPSDKVGTMWSVMDRMLARRDDK
jgi:hypothetical protein